MKNYCKNSNNEVRCPKKFMNNRLKIIYAIVKMIK